ncbi:MAG TPA: hypothetical protein VHD32_10180 [Candidatus Didemnitutus sp.]|nr:hypothetical protein [Candidatus Didemnitutus sp.]
MRLLAALAACVATTLLADPLTKQTEIDFGRDVASRNLKGLATRSDGRVFPGPVFNDLKGPRLADLLWTLRPLGNDRFLVGTGPDGKILEVALNAHDATYTVRDAGNVIEAQVLAVQPLADGAFLAGTSPAASVYLFRGGKAVARVPLTGDSVFDFLALPDGTVLAATGNPGRIYRIDPAKLAKAGVPDAKSVDSRSLADRGITVFAEVRDRNVRRLARLPDGRIIAGSAPKGNVYVFPATGGSPTLLQENREAEVVDLLPVEDGGFFAAVAFSPGEGNRVIRLKNSGDDKDKEEKDAKSTFPGRSTLVYFPPDGFPETVVSRAGLSFYRLARHQNWLLIAAGEQGDILGYDPTARRSLVFAGSESAQLNDLAPLSDGNFAVLRDNAPGLALMTFTGSRDRTLETRRIDLGNPAELGLVRFTRLRNVDPAALKVQARINMGSDEIEGWSPWTDLKPVDDAFSAVGLRGRYLKLRVEVPSAATDFQIDKATAYYLPQDRRPQLGDFRIFPPNLGIVPSPEPSAPVATTLGQLLFPASGGSKEDLAGDKRKSSFLSSQVIPQTGSQIIYWSVTDPENDNLAYTLSIKPDNSDTWTDLAVDTRDTYVQFDTGAFPEGLYLTRLTVTEQAPRPEKQRLSFTFETDFLTIDRTPPEITNATVEHRDGKLIVTVDGHDARSLLAGADFILNNGAKEETEHPADGVLDSKTERFVAEFPESRATGATSVEIILYDQGGNSSSKRLPLK